MPARLTRPSPRWRIAVCACVLPAVVGCSSESIRATLPPVGTQGLPFVVLSGNERLYLGAFWTGVSSEAFPHPVVVVESMDRLGFRIEGGYPTGGGDPADPRADPRLLAALRHAGKLVE